MLIVHLLVLLVYFILSVALTWPLILHWSTGVYAGNSDGFVYPGFDDASQNIWNMWWVRYALERYQNPFWTNMLYYPEGVQMYLQTMNLPDAVITMPIHYLAGPVAAYNTAILVAFTLTAYAGFMLVRTWVPGVAIPILCGALLTACPFHMVKLQVNQLHLISMQWVPFYVLALFQLSQPQKNYAFIHVIVFFLLAALTSWYWALVCGLFTLIWFPLSLVCTSQRWQVVQRYLFCGAGIFICLTPLFIGIFQVRDRLPAIEPENSTSWAYQTLGYSAHPLGLLFPSGLHPLWGSHLQYLIRSIIPGYSPDGWYIAAGWVLIVCTSMGIWWYGRTYWRLLAVGVVMWFLSLGPTLYLNGTNTGIALPYALIQDLPLVSSGRKPSLFAVMCIVIATLFAGMGLHRLVQHRSSRQRRLLLCGMALLAGIELWPPVKRPLLIFEQPVFFEEIRTRPGAVADLPFDLWSQSGRSLRHQIIHEQPILGGYIARWPAYESFYVPLLNRIGRMQNMPDIVPLNQETLAAMQCYYPLRHVVVRKDVAASDSLGQLRSFLNTLNGAPLRPTFEDNTYIWYELPLFQKRCQPFVYLGRGWYDVEGEVGSHWRWASSRSDIWLVNPFDAPLTARLELATDSFAHPRPVALWREDEQLAEWHVGSFPQQADFVVQLLPGINHLQLRAEPWLDPVSGRELTVPVREVTLWP
jgi:hypothetical protein